MTLCQETIQDSIHQLLHETLQETIQTIFPTGANWFTLLAESIPDLEAVVIKDIAAFGDLRPNDRKFWK